MKESDHKVIGPFEQEDWDALVTSREIVNFLSKEDSNGYKEVIRKQKDYYRDKLKNYL